MGRTCSSRSLTALCDLCQLCLPDASSTARACRPTAVLVFGCTIDRETFHIYARKPDCTLACSWTLTVNHISIRLASNLSPVKESIAAGLHRNPKVRAVKQSSMKNGTCFPPFLKLKCARTNHPGDLSSETTSCTCACSESPKPELLPKI